MSIKIVDNPNIKSSSQNPRDKSELGLDSLAVSESEGTIPNATAQGQSNEELPEKYRGKSPAEIARMHQELESRFGQQGNEVGELRRNLDAFILNRLQDRTQAQPTKVEEAPVDFFDDPKKAVSHEIKNSPEIQRLLEGQQRVERAALQQQLKNSHPDYEKHLRDGEFQKWIESSRLRQRLLKQADQNYDVEAADELFSEWETMNKSREDSSNALVGADKQARKQEIKKASTGTARGNSSGTSSKKTFRRVDIVELMKNDPRRYESLAAEIRQAYAEGRVR